MSDEDLWESILEGSQRKTIVMDGANQKIIDSDNYLGRPVLGKIVILPRSSVLKFNPDKNWAAISISDIDAQFPNIPTTNVLRLEFDDVEFPSKSLMPINEEQAKKIWKFVEKVWDEVELLMVHCHAGISRSPAVGQCISEKYQPEFAEFFDQLYSPNQLVLETLRKTKSS